MRRVTRTLRWFAAGLLSMTTLTGAAQQADVTFFVVGKAARHYQQPDESMKLWRYHVFAEVFLTEGGELSNLAVTLPGPDSIKLIPQLRPTKSKLVNDVYKFDNLHFQSEMALNRLIPNGEYAFDFDTPSGNVRGRTVRLDGGAVPPSPVISLLQGGREVALETVDPTLALTVRWSAWPQGAADPHGILDDLIFVAAHHCVRDYAIHSGRPFEGTPYLTYAAREFVIKAGDLEPGRTYTLFVEFADLVDTNVADGIEGLATYTNQTYVEFKTTGTAASACPAKT